MVTVTDVMEEVIHAFRFPGELQRCESYGSGHINDTFLLEFVIEGGVKKRYILQRMNKTVFEKPIELMENIMGVTSWVRDRIIESGGNPERETLNVVLTKKGEYYYLDSEREYWRVYLFIEGATSYDTVENPDDFYQSAVAFGNFQRRLAGYPAKMLHETIENFHNTIDRYEKLMESVECDVCERVAEVRNEIRFVQERQELVYTLCEMQDEGDLPIRVTHNDTKLNNIMIDDVTGRGICVIDLDTVMPGLSVNDFGDSIRFGASTGAEDEPDLSKISCDMGLFDLYAKGYIRGCGGSLTENEIAMLPAGAMTMTFECGMRFLTDYLQGDVYFKIHREKQNLDRCRTQFKLVADMEEKMDQMNEIVQRYSVEI